jgi:hypothetical protein
MENNIELNEIITNNHMHDNIDNKEETNKSSPDFSLTNSPMKKRLKLIDLAGDLDNIAPSYYNNIEEYEKKGYDLLEKSTSKNMFMLLIRNIKAATPVNWIFILFFSCVLTSKKI